MKYGVSEVFDCLDVAFDRKKILLQLAGIAISVGAVFLSSWIGGQIKNDLTANIINILGMVAVFLIMATIFAAISRMAYKELTVGEKLSQKEALAFSKKNLVSIIFSPVIIVAAGGAVLLAEYLIFILGRFSAFQIIISIFSVPVLLINAVIALTFALAVFFIYPIIAVDESGPIKTSRKILSAAVSAPVKVLCGSALTALLGIPVILSLASILFLANISTISMFGTASGIFEAMKATEIPSIPVTTYVAWSIFLVSLSALSGAVLSFALVFTKTAAVSIYLSIKSSLK
ncbi:MAG: hypothetical protein WC527_00900 [Candidatus Margulisiibacteriota bacterium]